MVKPYMTALPTVDHDGVSTLPIVERVIGMMRASGVSVQVMPGAQGLWYGDDGELYTNGAVVLYLWGEEAPMRRALAQYGEQARQYEVLFVERTNDYIIGRGRGLVAAAELAKVHGGATLLPDGRAVSVRYAALVHGVDYQSTVTGVIAA